MAQRVGHGVEAAIPPHFGAGVEGLQLQGGVIQGGLGLWVAREEDLEATVKQEPVHIVGPYASTDAIRSF
jgi:hypothetical protein